MRINPSVTVVAMLSFVSLATACGGDKKSIDAGGVSVAFNGDSAKKEPAMGPGDVKIVSTDNVLVLSVIGDSLRIQLSDSLKKTVTDNVDSSMKDNSAIGAAIAKSVASVVSGAMGFIAAVDVNDVQNVRYEDGHIKFDVKGGKTKIDTDGNSRDKAVFSPEDAKKFMDAIKARQGPDNR